MESNEIQYSSLSLKSRAQIERNAAVLRAHHLRLMAVSARKTVVNTLRAYLPHAQKTA